VYGRRLFRSASALVLLALLPAGASAASPPSGLLGERHCSVTFSGGSDVQNAPRWNSPARGTLVLHGDYRDGENVATTYELQEGYYAERPSGRGRWAWDGSRITFLDGPLAAPEEGWSLDALYAPELRRMPHDTEHGRTFSLVVRSLTDQRPEYSVAPALAGHEGEDVYRTTYWYCGEYGHSVRDAAADVLPYVRRVTGVPIRLPQWFPTPSRGQWRHTGRVRLASRGSYRIGFFPEGCEASDCGDSAIFSAKRAPASDLGHRRRVRLGHGVIGWVGNYGCAFNGTDPDWGPTYCGRSAIVWHQRGVNYCIEAPGLTETDFVAAARQAVASRPA
jgi:hypothetical protein